MPPKPNRSPVLGYNHNLKYRGRIFHLQTEDSGPQNPRLFTHLYFGGTILASKKLEYDPAAAEDVVRALMQSQHKSILKELKAGKHDERIVRFFTARGETLDAAAALAAPLDASDSQALDLDAAPVPGAPSSVTPIPTLATAPPAAPATTTFEDTFEDEPTTPDQAAQLAAARQRSLGADHPHLAGAPSIAPAPRAHASADPTLEMVSPSATADSLGGPSNVVPLPDAAARRRPVRTPALGAPVLIERAIGVGQQISASARALFRGKRPSRSIPYVVKEGTHPLAEEPSPLSGASPLTPPPTTAANASLTSTVPGRYQAPAPAPAEKTLDEVILAYLSQGSDDR